MLIFGVLYDVTAHTLLFFECWIYARIGLISFFFHVALDKYANTIVTNRMHMTGKCCVQTGFASHTHTLPWFCNVSFLL